MTETPYPQTPTRPRWLIAAAMILVLVVVLAAFALSFTVLRDLAAMSGIPQDVAWLWPVIVDGTIAAATLVFYTSRDKGRRLAMTTLILFGVASVVGNVSHILLVDPSQVIPVAIAVFVGVMPPVGLIMTVELLGSLLRSRRTTATVEAQSTVDDTVDQGPVSAEPDPAHTDDPSVSPEPGPHVPEPAHPADPMDHVNPGLAHEPEVAHTDEPSVGQVSPEPREPEPSEPRMAHGTPSWATAEPAHERLAPVPPADQDWLTRTDQSEPVVEPAPIMSLVPTATMGQDHELTPEPSTSSQGEPVDHDEPIAEPEPAHRDDEADQVSLARKAHEPDHEPGDPVPETTEDQVAWIAAQAQEGEPVTASVLVDRFAEAGIEMSLSTAKRRLAAARKEHPDAFEEAS